MTKETARRPGKDKGSVSYDLRASKAPLLGEDELIYRALQIAALRAERSVQDGSLTQDALNEIRHVMEAVDGQIPIAEHQERAFHLAHKHSLPEEMTLTTVLNEIRGLIEIGTLGEEGDAQRLFRLLPGLSRIEMPDSILKVLKSVKGRLFWAVLCYLRDPQDPRREEWVREISANVELVQKGLQLYLKEGTVASAEASLRAAMAQQNARQG
ncbi:MAG: hypothetical protein B7Y80_16925 [Hyphomicrobium sp. 32-62-53]|nr:MAG: hypothetical protein B7Z29_08035 [Hyphomicrobium sp. 12-62-95]OYX98059.1 MAG: hypothetical protein B7Y80_16925 [Hyphomicrobium sp. 32-62-53]